MIDGWRLEGHAIVSADDRIADRGGRMPAALRREADWVRFQAALDAAAATILGRSSHEAAPNTRGRRRVVMSAQARGLERRADAWWWNPAGAALAEVLATVAPGGGTIAIPGGRRVFDYFLAAGFDAFHLARATAVRLPGGIPIFSAIRDGVGASDVLSAAGLAPGATEQLAADLTLTEWQHPTDP